MDKMYAKLEDIIGKTATRVYEDDLVVFEFDDGTAYALHHQQDCCEQVYLADKEGEWEWLIGNPILIAEEVNSGDALGPIDSYDESYTWTFYKFATNRGHVDLRFYGSSNGYYSESVDFIKLR